MRDWNKLFARCKKGKKIRKLKPLTGFDWRYCRAFMVNTDKEFIGGLKYIATKNIGISKHYDSDMGWGAGLTLTY